MPDRRPTQAACTAAADESEKSIGNNDRMTVSGHLAVALCSQEVKE
ncbi:MAG: hypothetical protein R3C01_14010 [Planctomycetaceae bacterium]